MPNDVIRVLTTQGVRDIEVTDQGVRSLAGKHWNAVKRYLGTGDTDRLDPYAGQTVAGFELEIDPDVIDERESDGELDIDPFFGSGRR